MEQLVAQDPKEAQVFGVQQVPLVRTEPLEPQDQLELQDLPVPQVCLDLQVLQVCLDLPVPQVLQGCQEPQVLQVLLAPVL